MCQHLLVVHIMFIVENETEAEISVTAYSNLIKDHMTRKIGRGGGGGGQRLSTFLQ